MTTDVTKPIILPELKIRDGIFDNNVDVDKWDLPESKTFSTFLNNTFIDAVEDKIASIPEDDSGDNGIRIWDSKNKKFTYIRPFKHQLFVKEYLNKTSPYRGLLLYHGLGSGKSGASVVIAEGFSEKRVVIMLPASLATNYKQEIFTFGSQSYKTQNYWTFVPYSFGKITSKTKSDRDEIYQQFSDLGVPKQIIDTLTLTRQKKGLTSGIWLIDISKQYPNYISEEEKIDLEDHQRTQVEADDTEVISMLSDSDKEEIDLQVRLMYAYKYKFIHTNAGSSTITSILKLSPKFKIIKKRLFGSIKNSALNQEQKISIIDEMYKENINPFDNKVIVIDEIHNLAASIASSGFNAPLIYELLMRAQNIKLVLLSGTPVINNAYELAIICNLLKGFTKTYEFTLQSIVTDMDAFKVFIKSNKDIFNYQLDNKRLEIILHPTQFRGLDDNLDNFSVVIKSDVTTTYYDFTKSFLSFMRSSEYPLDESKEVVLHYYTLFEDILTGESTKWWKKDIRVRNVLSHTDTPIKEICPFRLLSSKHKKKSMAKFGERYINPTDLSVINVLDFKKRILGIISFYNEVASYDIANPIFPGIVYADITETEVYMSDYQFKLYVEEREVERKYEDLGKRLSNIDSIFNTANLFKVYSRTMGLMVFPPNIERPRHSKLRDYIRSTNTDISTGEEKRLLEKLYIEKCYESMTALKEGNLTYTDISEPYNLQTLSPKYTLILKNIDASPGLVFCYSQFRSIEGIGLLTKVLDANGYYLYNGHTKNKKGDTIDGDQSTVTYIISDKVRFETSTNNWNTYTIYKIEHDDDAVRETLYHLSSIEGTTITTTKDKIFRCHYSLWTGEEDVATRKELLNHFNRDENKYGNTCLLLLTTSAGAEGISLMNVRQVHILEPYWNNVRIKQVIGRARRVRSHILLPIDQRNVKIFQYIIRFTKEQLSGQWLQNPLIKSLEEQTALEDIEEDEQKIPIMNMSKIISQKDKGLTSDETLYTIANKKTTILDKFLKLFKEVAIDCEFNKRDNIQTNDIDVTDASNFACYTNLEDMDEDKQDSLSVDIFVENSTSDVIMTDDSSVIKEKKKIIVINQPTLVNGMHIHSLILDIPFEYTLQSYLEQNISQKVPLYNLYSYYELMSEGPHTKIIGYIIMNPDRTLSLTDIDTSVFTFDLIKQYMFIERAIQEIDVTIKSPLKKHADEITPSETLKWSSHVKDKMKELEAKETWACKICKVEYNVDIEYCTEHPRITKRLCSLLKDKQLKKELRLIS